jgi:Zn-dependent protease with chaperone function
MTGEPSRKLADVAAELNIPVAELLTPQAVCFVAGVLKPRVVVSTGALSRCSAEELRAALLHERAHCDTRATLWTTLASFLNQCSPLPVSSAIELLKHRGELSADREAARSVDPCVLVSAMLKLTESELRSPAVAHIADPVRLRDRVENLLFPVSERPHRPLEEILAGLLLLAMTSMALLPAGLHAAIRILTCHSCR